MPEDPQLFWMEQDILCGLKKEFEQNNKEATIDDVIFVERYKKGFI